VLDSDSSIVDLKTSHRRWWTFKSSGMPGRYIGNCRMTLRNIPEDFNPWWRF